MYQARSVFGLFSSRAILKGNKKTPFFAMNGVLTSMKKQD
jgi:hypothetical protein